MNSHRSNWSEKASLLSSSSSSSCSSSSTSSSTRLLLDTCTDCAGEAGLSVVAGVVSSMDDVELEHRRWPCVEKVDVTGDGTSDEDESIEYARFKFKTSLVASLCASSLFLLSSTNWGNCNGLSLGDMIVQRRSVVTETSRANWVLGRSLGRTKYVVGSTRSACNVRTVLTGGYLVPRYG